jgi:hypothetical protein
MVYRPTSIRRSNPCPCRLHQLSHLDIGIPTWKEDGPHDYTPLKGVMRHLTLKLATVINVDPSPSHYSQTSASFTPFFSSNLASIDARLATLLHETSDFVPSLSGTVNIRPPSPDITLGRHWAAFPTNLSGCTTSLMTQGVLVNGWLGSGVYTNLGANYGVLMLH